jgi:hypothetical protein
MDGSTRKFGRVATGALACAALVGSLASCSPPPPKAAPSYPLVDTAIYDDRARELIRERGIELLAHGAQPAWWTSLTELSGNVATIPASGAAGDLQVALALAGRNAKAAATELLGTEPLTIEFVHSACRRTDAGQIEAMVLARALGPARAQVQGRADSGERTDQDGGRRRDGGNRGGLARHASASRWRGAPCVVV